jgi:glycerol-3-phosphate dehydrogenase (NAD(P)+)
MTFKVAVLGAGAWGTALARLLAERNDGPVTLWSRRREISDAINASGENARYLPGIALPAHLSSTHDLEVALSGANMIVLVVPSHAVREVACASAAHVLPGVPVVCATKGMEADSLLFMDEVIAQELPQHGRDQLAFISGPSFAKELAMHRPTAVVVAARDAEVGTLVMKRFHTPYLRTYASDDVAGVECGGALKNVIAIAAGACDGLGLGHNARAALITRGIAEIAKLAMARGGSALTLAGLAGLGDLVLTCTGEPSRNRTVGYEMARGRTLDDVLAGLGHVAEGITTAKSAHELSTRLGVEMPITSEVHAVLYEDKPVSRAVHDLMARDLGYEFDPGAIARATLGLRFPPQ